MELMCKIHKEVEGDMEATKSQDLIFLSCSFGFRDDRHGHLQDTLNPDTAGW